MPPIQVKVPSPGESVTEGRIAQWLKADGSTVQVDEPLFELESDKASLTVAAEAAGILRILIPEGEVVAVGSVVAEIDPAAVAAAPAAAKPSGPAANVAETASPQAPRPPASTPALTAPPPFPSAAVAVASPAAQRILAERGLSASDVPGTGPRGIITKADALAFQPPAAATVNGVPAATPGTAEQRSRETRQPMTMIRRRTAERLLESQRTTATLTTFNEADMSAIIDLRTRYNEKFEKKHGTKLGFMSVFVKAAIEALKAFPLVNSRIDGNDIVIQHFYDIGVAVSSEKGLFVPVIRDADRLSFAEIEKTLADLAKRARDGKITVPEMLGGTFTITNGGVFGSLLSTPILNPPQTAILGMHTIQKRPVAINDQVVIRPMMYLALSYDHRLIDGREAVQFLVRIKECVENPERMLLDV
jgi:2-oxoglutarate dehydrogenase E2 component (dihydrolipoamide succinyltransferase)